MVDPLHYPCWDIKDKCPVKSPKINLMRCTGPELQAAIDKLPTREDRIRYMRLLQTIDAIGIMSGE